MKSSISHYKGVFGWFKSSFEVCFGLVLILVGNLLVKNGKDASFQFQADASPPKRRSICLGKPKALKFPVSTSPRQRLLRLSQGLRLGKPEVLFLFLSSVNSRNHQLD